VGVGVALDVGFTPDGWASPTEVGAGAVSGTGEGVVIAGTGAGPVATGTDEGVSAVVFGAAASPRATGED
jgi:hypothetical protein